MTSEFMAFSIGVNPVIVRKLLSQLKDAGLAEVRRGPGGAVPARPLDEITLLDIYRAVDCIGENTLFHFHKNPNSDCPVGKNIHRILDGRLAQVQDAMERELESITLGMVKAELK